MTFQIRETHLPDFPWDQLAPYANLARQHPNGAIDLSVGTPVDPVPPAIQAALAEASDSPGYPLTVGTQQLRQAFVDWLSRVHGATGLTDRHVLPTVGSKELVALLPSLLRFDARDVIAIPKTAYPTYDIGGRLAGCKIAAADGLDDLEAARRQADAAGRSLAMAWLNTPSNPTGRVTDVAELRAIVEWGRQHSILIVSDECYIDLGWEAQPLSLANPVVSGGSLEGLLVVHSLSKRSNLAGYRIGFVAGDERVIAHLLEVRKHAGLMVSSPVQRAAIAALQDESHVAAQKQRYRARRDIAKAAITAAGFRIDHSEAGLYLWATRQEDCWQTVQWLSQRGVIAAPGSFYGLAGSQHVRLALTATDERFSQLADRLK